MKAVEKVEGLDTNYDYRITRMSWHKEMRAVSIFQGARLLLGASVASVLLTTLMFGVYVVPLMLIFGLLIFSISKLILRGVYSVITPTRQVRWTANSCLYFFWTAPIWVLLPGLLVFAATAFGLIPFGIWNLIYHSSTFDMSSADINLFFKVYGDLINAAGDPIEALKMFFFWDPTSPMMSTVKFTIMPVIGYIGFFSAHPEVSEEEFINSEQNIWLMYEQR